jgi:hypothetical protein
MLLAYAAEVMPRRKDVVLRLSLVVSARNKNKTTHIPKRVVVEEALLAGGALRMPVGALQVSFEHLVAIEVRVAERAVLDVECRRRG